MKNHEIILIESLETYISEFFIHTRNQVKIPGRHIIVLDVKVNPMKVPYVLINLAKESVLLSKGELLGSLEPVEEDIGKIVTSTAMEMMNIEIEENQNTEVGEDEKKFSSPADVEVH